ncbi:hypothetical protein CCH79_00003518, partial [Gambusia affinis]
EGDSLGAMEKVCRQLTYHLSPHSQWRRQGLLKRKPQAWRLHPDVGVSQQRNNNSSPAVRLDPCDSPTPCSLLSSSLSSWIFLLSGCRPPTRWLSLLRRPDFWSSSRLSSDCHQREKVRPAFDPVLLVLWPWSFCIELDTNEPRMTFVEENHPPFHRIAGGGNGLLGLGLVRVPSGLLWEVVGDHLPRLSGAASSASSLKLVLSAPLSSGALDLSGIPLTTRDMERLSAHLQRHASNLVSLELGFTELTDEAFLQLLPTLAALPHLETLALNGNRLTRAILKELTDALKDPSSFPSVTWIDLGNNVDIFSLPQPFLVSLRKRCPKQGNLPTILEFGESQASDPPDRQRGLGEEEETDDTNLTESMGELRSEVEEEMDGETEIEEMMEELLDFDREIQGKDDEEDSMWTLGEQRIATVRSRRAWREEEEKEKEKEKADQRRDIRPRRRAVMAEDEDDTQSRSSRLSCSSQSQHSFAVVEPIRVEEEDMTDQSEHLT